MKLASYKHKRDGKLMVVSRDLGRCHEVHDIAPTMQALLDDWDVLAPKLQPIYEALNEGRIEGELFDERACASPLPRAYQWADGSAYVTHVVLVRKARGAEIPESFWTDPLMYQGGSDAFLGPREDIPVEDTSWGVDLEAEIAVITDDVPMGVLAADAAAHIKLFMLVNDVSLRGLIPGELAKGFGFFQSKPSSAFSPVAVTPDELGEAWREGKLHLPLISHINGDLFGQPNAGVDMTFSFPELLAHAAKTRPLGAGAIIGSGTIANKNTEEVGSSCLAERRMLETIADGKPDTSFLSYGDTVRIEMNDAEGESIFGTIEQTVVPYQVAKKVAA